MIQLHARLPSTNSDKEDTLMFSQEILPSSRYPLEDMFLTSHELRYASTNKIQDYNASKIDSQKFRENRFTNEKFKKKKAS